MSTVETLPPKVWLAHKEKADQAFRTGHYSDAIDFYSDAVNACNSSSATDRAKLFANRALAYQREGRSAVELVVPINDAQGVRMPDLKQLDRRC